MNSLIVVKKGNILLRKKIATKIIILVYIFFVINMPSFIKEPTTLYHIKSPDYIIFKLLDYRFSILELPLIVIGFFYYKRSKIVKFMPLLLIIIGNNILRLLFGMSNPITLRSYEMFLSLITGFAACSILCYLYRTKERLEAIFDTIIIINFISQILFIITGRAADGRVAVWGQDVGSIGFFSLTYLLIYLFSRRRNKLMIIALYSSIFSLILSGSRTNILILILVAIAFAPIIVKEILKNKKKRVALVSSIVVLIIIISLFVINSYVFDSQRFLFINRILELFTKNSISNNIANDSSFIERINTIEAGINVIKGNPFGLSNSYVDLQYETQKYSSLLFPHSYVITYYILWGYPVILILIYFIRQISRSILQKNQLTIMMVVLLILLFVYGGPIISPKVYLWFFLLFTYFKLNLYNKVDTLVVIKRRKSI